MSRCIYGDFHAKETQERESDYLMHIDRLRNTNAAFCTLEYSFDYDGYPYNDEMPFLRQDRRWSEGDRSFLSRRDQVYDMYTAHAHKLGIELFAGERMSMASFSLPYSRPYWKRHFVDEHPEYYCINRDGSSSKICSYAFSEVQNYVLDNMKDVVRHGFDGVTMIFHRGVFLGFEKPVIDRFLVKYPDADPLVLPLSDPRITQIYSDIMTEFMRKVREYFGSSIKINVISDYGLESAKMLGIDLRRWAKEGLVDIISQADMEVYEDLTDCMSDTVSGRIDLVKYKNRVLDHPIIRRNFATDFSKITSHISEYLELEREYGVQVYHVLPWANSTDTAQYLEYVDALKKLGAKRFLAWNSYAAASNSEEWYTISHIGNQRDDSFPKRRFIRMLEIDNHNLRYAYHNWRG